MERREQANSGRRARRRGDKKPKVGGAGDEAREARCGGAAWEARCGGAAWKARRGGAAWEARCGGAAWEARCGGAPRGSETGRRGVGSGCKGRVVSARRTSQWRREMWGRAPCVARPSRTSASARLHTQGVRKLRRFVLDGLSLGDRSGVVPTGDRVVGVGPHSVKGGYTVFGGVEGGLCHAFG